MRFIKPPNQSLSARYIRFFFLTLVLPVFLSGIALDLINFSRFRDSAVEQMQDIADQLAESIDSELSQIQILSAALVNNTDFLETCSQFALAQDDRTIYLLRQKIDLHLAGFFNYTNKIGTVYLFFRDKELYYYQNYPTSQSVETLDRSIYAPALERRGLNYVIPDLKGVNPVDSRHPLLSIAVSPGEAISRDGLEAVIISFRIKLLDLIDKGMGPASRAVVAIVGKDGSTILTSPNISELDFSLGSLMAGGLNDGLVKQPNGASVLVSTAGIESADWRLFRAVDYQGFIRPLQRARWVTYAFFIVLSLFFVVYTRLFFHDLIRPLQQVIDRMRIVQTGDYQTRVPVKGPLEIAQLGSAFNQMITEVQKLTRDAEEKEREKTRFEMEALQYRIHPHFVANTLNSIRLMAETEGNPHIAEMSSSLMHLVSESFNRGGRMISLNDEIRSIESYVHIMKVRFGELIKMSYDIPVDCGSYYLLKMLLQPVVENAILHGIRESSRSGHIDVRAAVVQQSLEITVRDNGVGMDPKSLHGLLVSPGPASSGGLTRIGLFNVHRRITLNYGDEYGLRISSEPGEGTQVVFRLPLLGDSDG